MAWRRALPPLAIRLPRGSPGYRTGGLLLKILALLGALQAALLLPVAAWLAAAGLGGGGPGLSGAAWALAGAALGTMACVAASRAYLAWVDAAVDAPARAARAAAWGVGWSAALLVLDVLPQMAGFFPLGVRHLHPLLWLDPLGLGAAALGGLGLAASAGILANTGTRREMEFADRARWVPRYVDPASAAAQWRCPSCGIAYAVPAAGGVCPTCRAARGGAGTLRKNIE